MPRGGRREGAGRPHGSGRFGEPTRRMDIPLGLVGQVSELLAAHQRAAAVAAIEKRHSAKQGRGLNDTLEVPEPGTASIVGPIDALSMLNRLAEQGIRAATVVLDPWYRAKGAQGRSAYLTETVPLLEAASRVADHVFIWGFPEAVARLIDHTPSSVKLEGWLTWYFKNAPSRSKSWRPSQQACLHLRRPDAKMYPEHFYAERHREAAKQNRLEFKMTPFSVFEEALLSGFIKRSEQTGFRWQKPESVIAPLLRMTTRPGDLVVDPTAGSGTTGAVALKLGCAAILSDGSASALKTAQKRLRG